MDGKTKDGTAILDMKDLSKFIWPETAATSEPRSLSMWRDGIELVQGIRTEDGTKTDPAAIAKMDFFTERGFSVRVGVVPRAVGTALVFVVAAARSLEKLKVILEKNTVSERNPLIPTVGVRASRMGKHNAAEVLYIPSEKSLGVPRAG